jgi:Tol biopolymer transport system component
MQKMPWKSPCLAWISGLLFFVLAPLQAGDRAPAFSDWSAPVSLGSVVNSATAYDACPTISKDGLSLYFRSNRPGAPHDFDIWVSQRDAVEDPWGVPSNLGPTINGSYDELCSAFSPDGHWLVFVSSRPGCGGHDLWISHRKNKRDDFGWEAPQNLGCGVNSSWTENGPALIEDPGTGKLLLYFSSNRTGGPGLLDIYVAEAEGDEKDVYGLPILVNELNTSQSDYQPVLRKDGLEIFFASARSGGSGGADLWTSTRDSVGDLWSPPVNLGSRVNSPQPDFHPTLSFDGTTLIFASDRLGGSPANGDLWMSSRSKLGGPR